MQFTIESRELTHESHSSATPELKPTTVEAANPDDAISEFVRLSDCELVSFSKPSECRESIATVRKADAVFLVRIYQA